MFNIRTSRCYCPAFLAGNDSAPLLVNNLPALRPPLPTLLTLSTLTGTGKTSLVTALAGELGLDVYVVTLSRFVKVHNGQRFASQSAAQATGMLSDHLMPQVAALTSGHPFSCTK